MHTKCMLSVLLALLVTLTSLMVLLPSNSTTPIAAAPAIPGNTFYGIISIAPNGSVVYRGTGNTDIMSQNGNNYNLTGEILGEINIEHNGTVLNGMDHSVTGDTISPPNMLNITNVTGVFVTNLTMVSASQTGIYIENASDIHVSEVNVSAYEFAVQVLANTENINVSNSRFSFDPSSTMNLSTVDDGMAMSSLTDAVPLSTSHNNHFFNDSIYGSTNGQNYNYPYLLSSNSTNTVFNKLHFIGPAFNGALLTADNESMIHSTFTGKFIDPFEVYPSSPPQEVTNISVLDNTFDINRSTSFLSNQLTVISIRGISNISNNVIDVNNTAATLGGSVAAMIVASPSFRGFIPAGMAPGPTNETSVTDNIISILGAKTSSASMIGMMLVGYNGNAKVSNNAVTLTNDSFGMGIYAAGDSNLSISQNTILAKDSSIEGIDAYDISSTSVAENTILGDNTSTGDGIVSIFGQGDTVNNNTIGGVYYDINLEHMGNLTFNGNYLEDSNTSVRLDATNYSEFYHNDFTGYSYMPANVTNSTHLLFNLSSPIGGNYWSTYTGSALSNGFGSTPFTVSMGLEDYLPLTHQWTRPNAVFAETGLPSGTQWSVTFNGHTKSSTHNTISFSILDGTYTTYHYTVGIPAGYYGDGGNGSFQYTGSSFTNTTTFTHYAYLEGTILPYNATVLLNGVLMSGMSNGSFNISIKAGYYELIVNESGYVTHYMNFTVASGQTEQVNISLNRTSTAGIPVVDYYYIGIGTTVAAIAGGTVVFLRRRNGP